MKKAVELGEKFFIDNISTCSKEANRIYELIDNQNAAGEVSLEVDIKGSPGVRAFVQRELERDGFTLTLSRSVPLPIVISW